MQKLEAARAYRDAQLKYNVARSKQLGDPLLWAESLWHIRGDLNQPYSIAKYPFLKEIAASKERYLVVMSSAGGGKTEFFLPYALANADWGRKVLYCFEQDMKTSLIVQERVNPNIKNNPYFRERCKDVDNIKLKKFGSGIVYFLGLGSDSPTTSYHGDILIRDERDKMDQARAEAMEGRLESSDLRIIRDISNPSLPLMGIDLLFKQGDRRQWHVPCAKCGHVQPLKFHDYIDQKTGRCRCPKCKEDHNRLAPGYWKPTNVNAAKHHSYQITGMMNPNLDIPKVLEKLASTRPDILATVWNMSLGEPYEAAESGLSIEDLRKSVHKIGTSKSAPGGFLVCDPGSLYDVQLYQAENSSGVANCVWAGTVEDFDELEKLAYDSGVRGGVVDYMPELKGAAKFCAKMNKRGFQFVRAAYTLDGADAPRFELSKEHPNLVNVHRTLFAEDMVEAVRKRLLRFPEAYTQDETSRWFQQMRAPRREYVAARQGGIPVLRWNHDDGRPDHQFHCSLYATVWRAVAKILPRYSSSGSQVVFGGM